MTAKVVPNITAEAQLVMRQQAALDAMSIRSKAGCVNTALGRIGSGATPGYDQTLVDGVDLGPVGSYVDWGSTLSITSDATASAASSEGNGSRLEPYIIDLKQWYNKGAATSTDHFVEWDDPVADYYIKFTNCFFKSNWGETGAQVSLIRINIRPYTDPNRSRCIFENCEFFAQTPANVASILIESGDVIINKCIASRHYGPFVKMHTGLDTGGETLKVNMEDLWCTGKDGNWSAGGPPDSGTMVSIQSVGATIVGKRITFAPGNNSLPIEAYEDFAMEMDRLDVNTNGRPLTFDAVGDWAFERQKTFTNCNFQAPSNNGVLFATSAADRTIARNMTFLHCNFLGHPAPTANNPRLIDIGVGGVGQDQITACSNIKLLNCFFTQPATFNDSHAPGNEIMMFIGCSDITIDGCWCDTAWEDVYELHTCWGNNVISNCGGENVWGQMVDIYQAPDRAAGLNCEISGHIHHIYGDCGVANGVGGQGGEAVALGGVSNYLVHDIYVDNSVDTVTLASIVIKDSPNGIPNNNTIIGPLPLNASCANGAQIAEVVTGAGITNTHYYYIDEDGIAQTSGTLDVIPIR